MLLQAGERFPALKVKLVDGRECSIPEAIPGSNKVLLFYRGGW